EELPWRTYSTKLLRLAAEENRSAAESAVRDLIGWCSLLRQDEMNARGRLSYQIGCDLCSTIDADEPPLCRALIAARRRAEGREAVVAVAPSVEQQVVEESPFRFSDDFRSCLWGTETFSFTTKQAAVVQSLWNARQNGTPELSQVALLEVAGSSMANNAKPQLSKLFTKNRAWGTMIVPGETRGAFRLADPPR